jgi:hypothetical protein
MACQLLLKLLKQVVLHQPAPLTSTSCGSQLWLPTHHHCLNHPIMITTPLLLLFQLWLLLLLLLLLKPQ